MIATLEAQGPVDRRVGRQRNYEERTDMELKIDPEAVNKLVADAVLNSAIGEAVKKAVEKEIANLTRSYDNPLESVVRNHVAEIARTVLREEHGEAIKARLSAALAAKLSDDFIDRVCEKAAERY